MRVIEIDKIISQQHGTLVTLTLSLYSVFIESHSDLKLNYKLNSILKGLGHVDPNTLLLLIRL